MVDSATPSGTRRAGSFVFWAAVLWARIRRERFGRRARNLRKMCIRHQRWLAPDLCGYLLARPHDVVHTPFAFAVEIYEQVQGSGCYRLVVSYCVRTFVICFDYM